MIDLDDFDAIGMGPPCPGCGLATDWLICTQIGCEDGYYDAHEYDDPLFYDPGEMIKCEDCNGRGGWWYCSECEKVFDKNDPEWLNPAARFAMPRAWTR